MRREVVAHRGADGRGEGALADRTEDRLILDLRRLLEWEPAAFEQLASALAAYRDRIRVVMPASGECVVLAAVFALYR